MIQSLFLSLLLITTMSAPVELKPGDKAPDFKAVSTSGAHISLKQYHGKQNVVLYFYPEDMTPGCTIEEHHFRDDHKLFADANTVVLGVSLDSREKHEEFTLKDSLNFPLLVDTDTTICKAYGVPIDLNWPRRWTFLIGKDGKIVKVYHNVDVKKHSKELLHDIAAHDAAHAAGH